MLDEIKEAYMKRKEVIELLNCLGRNPDK